MVLLTVLATSQFLQAQEDTASKSLNEVVITANKFPQKLSNTGKVLTVITREQIERSAGKDLAQILTEQTGVLTNGAYSNPGKDKTVFLRGAAGKYTLFPIPITRLITIMVRSNNFNFGFSVMR